MRTEYNIEDEVYLVNLYEIIKGIITGIHIDEVGCLYDIRKDKYCSYARVRKENVFKSLACAKRKALNDLEINYQASKKTITENFNDEK